MDGDVAAEQADLVVRCLLQGELVHQETGRCWAVLEEGPCGAGQWLEPDWENGMGVCRKQLECGPGEEAGWWATLLQILFPFLLAGLGMVAAGLVLDIVQVRTAFIINTYI